MNDCRNHTGKQTTPIWGENIDGKLVLGLLDISRTMRSLYEGRGSQKRILIVLSETGTITQRELTARLGIQPVQKRYPRAPGGGAPCLPQRGGCASGRSGMGHSAVSRIDREWG